MAKRILLDIESNGLIKDVTKAWIIGWRDLDTNQVYEWHDGDLGWQEELNKVDLIVGHNVEGYDLVLLFKLFGFRLRKGIRVRDTMIMSKVLNYKRFGNEGHSMERWGQFLQCPKGESPDFSQYSEEMRTYWLQDLELNLRIYKVVLSEFEAIYQTSPMIADYLKAEGAVARWCGLAEMYGWPMRVNDAKELFKVLDAEMQSTVNKIEPRLGKKTIAVDCVKDVVDVKTPKWTKAGLYHHHTASWFGIDPITGQDDDRLIEGDYCRIQIEPLLLSSVQDVKTFLFRHNWQPTEWNYKINPDGRGKIKTSPKITEDSLDALQGDGKLYCDYLTTKSRYGILNTWLEQVDANNNLHGECITIGTPSMRATHKTIVNVPTGDSPWGREMRALFTTKPGWKLIGCDSAGNQARGLAHYLQSEEFTHQLLHGDIHTFNANALDTVLRSMGIDWDAFIISKGVKADTPHTPEQLAEFAAKGEKPPKVHTLAENIALRKRGNAKRILYAFLFGAGGDKLWSYIFGTFDSEQGNKLKRGFEKAVPGFKSLIEKLENVFGKTKTYGEGYIYGIAGNRIYCDSFHKLLVYLLQACEKATCAAAVMLTMERLEAAGIPYQPCIMYHDEEDFLVPEEYAEQAAAIGKQAFADGPKLFGITIMDGGAKTGNDWYEVH